MAEGENTLQSVYQQIGERSGNTNTDWEGISRTYRIEGAAQRFGIPERSWNHPTIHSFVEATLDARDLQTALSIGDAQHSFVAQWNYALHGSERPVPPGAPGMNPPLSTRYMDGELLMRGVTQILEYGLEEEPTGISNYLESKIGIVTHRFGVMVTELPEDETRIPETQTPAAMPGSAWADFQQTPQSNLYARYSARYGSQNFKLWTATRDLPRITNQTEDQTQVRVFATASRLGIPEQSLNNPTVREFVNNLHNIEDLLYILEQGEAPPGAPGLNPPVAERYTMAAHLLTVAKAIMEEGFQGRTVDPQFVASHVNSAVSYFGLQARLQIEG